MQINYYYYYYYYYYNSWCSLSVRGAADEQLAMIRRAARRSSTPGCPVAKSDGGIYMTVKWTRPEDDGGGDITAYVIKYGVEDTSVDDYATVKVVGDASNFTFTDQLQMLTWYQFAVAAVNTAGQGEFSEFSGYIRTGWGKK